MNSSEAIEITEEMKQAVHGKADLLMKTVIEAIRLIFGPNYKPVLILSKEGSPTDLAILADVDNEEHMLTILRSAISRSQSGVMIDASDFEAKKHH